MDINQILNTRAHNDVLIIAPSETEKNIELYGENYIAIIIIMCAFI